MLHYFYMYARVSVQCMCRRFLCMRGLYKQIASAHLIDLKYYIYLLGDTFDFVICNMARPVA